MKGEECDDHRLLAIPAVMSSGDGEKDGHEHDLVMPGFRFHPTEEELIEFYLRRKVEGKRFNVEFITSLDLYRYDPWELPGSTASLTSLATADLHLFMELEFELQSLAY